MSRFDAAVIGAGSFGVWTARSLRDAGLTVALVDAFGAGNPRASSGGESRILRCGYGADEVYTASAKRSLEAWRELSERCDPPLFHPAGMLWLGRRADPYLEATLAALHRAGVPNESLEREELARRFPQFALGAIEWGVLEPESGAILSRRAVRAAAEEAVAAGVVSFEAPVEPPRGEGLLGSLALSSGEPIEAGVFVFACGAWLGKLFPDVLGDRIFPTRQEVFYFGTPPADPRFRMPEMPVWLDLTEEAYGFPDIEGKGFKFASDRHGPLFDPDSGDRSASTEGAAEARRYLVRRFPALAEAPILSAEVCQYENTSNGDFLIDRHPGLEDVWLVGGGSGHGFKHGPAVGELVAELVIRGGRAEPRFRLESKASVQRRMVR
jgi:sarcosine oxidase